tara:strand:- start:31 stop:627 length:597 start_codon:yes stop_codon:yes gene_type:complete
MSKISYCSLEEAWGTSLNKKEDKDHKIKEKTEKINNNEKDYEELNAFKSKSQMDYESLKEDNEKMKKILNTMNLIERNKTPENNINDDYNKYRFNPVNQVNGLYNTNNYKPFQDDIEKKSLQDRFVELENEFRRYKTLMNTKNNNLNEEEESIESFMNFNNQNNTDIQDLIVLIVLGLIIIFIMDNIFKLGKYMGSKK